MNKTLINDYSNLDSQSDMSNLATINSNELPDENVMDHTLEAIMAIYNE